MDEFELHDPFEPVQSRMDKYRALMAQKDAEGREAIRAIHDAVLAHPDENGAGCG